MTKPRKKLLLRFDRALSDSLLKQVFILAGILMATLLVSLLLLSLSKTQWFDICQNKQISPFLLPIYLLIDQNVFNELYLGQESGQRGIEGWLLIACGLTYIFGVIIFNGMLVGVIVNAISERVDDHRNGLTHYLNSGHYIIMGYDDMVPSVVEDIFMKDKDAYVLLMTAVNANTIREKLKKSVAKGQMDHIIVNYGHRTAEEYYEPIHLETAKEIYVVGWRQKAYHDAVNIECVDSICTYLKTHKSDSMPRRITCVFEDLDTYAAFKTTEIFEEVGKLGIEFVPYNFYAGWARQVFVARSYKEKNNPTQTIAYPRIYGNGISPSDKRQVHLVFIGTTNFAVSFAMEAAQMLHFPNFDEKTKTPKTRITFIEKNAEDEMAQFLTRNRHFFEIQSYLYRDLTDGVIEDPEVKSEYISPHFKKTDFLDVEFEFIKGDVYTKAVQDLISGWAKDQEGQYLSIFLSLADQRFNFMMGLNMPDEVYDNAIPVFIRQDRADNFVTNLRNADNEEVKYNIAENGILKSVKRKKRYAYLYPFGMDDMAYFSEERALRQARLINFLYWRTNNNRFPDLLVLNSMTDDAIWEEAKANWSKIPVAEKWSNLYCAYGIHYKLEILRVMRGLDIDDTSRDKQPLSEEEIEQLGALEHNRWNVEKLLMGYRKAKIEEDKYEQSLLTAADVKPNKKNLFIHHDIRPFDDLDDIKQMDFEIVKYIPWILKMTEE